MADAPLFGHTFHNEMKAVNSGLIIDRFGVVRGACQLKSEESTRSEWIHVLTENEIDRFPLGTSKPQAQDQLEVTTACRTNTAEFNRIK